MPPKKDLIGHNKYPAKLYKFHNVDHIYCNLWPYHFYREYLVYFAYGEQMDSEKGKVDTKKRSPLCISRQERMANLNVVAEGELAAFLAFWLSNFVLPHGKEAIRLETFVVASLMASVQ